MNKLCFISILLTFLWLKALNAQEYTRKVLLEPSIPTPEIAFYNEFKEKRRANLYTIKGEVKLLIRKVTTHYKNGNDDTKLERLRYITENRFPKYQIKGHLQPFKFRNVHYKDSTLYKVYPEFYTQQNKTVMGWHHHRALEFKAGLIVKKTYKDVTTLYSYDEQQQLTKVQVMDSSYFHENNPNTLIIKSSYNNKGHLVHKTSYNNNFGDVTVTKTNYNYTKEKLVAFSANSSIYCCPFTKEKKLLDKINYSEFTHKIKEGSVIHKKGVYTYNTANALNKVVITATNTPTKTYVLITNKNKKELTVITSKNTSKPETVIYDYTEDEFGNPITFNSYEVIGNFKRRKEQVSLTIQFE